MRKKTHSSTPPAPKPRLDPLRQTLQQALAHYEAGRLVQMEALCHRVLTAAPQNADALHLLGAMWWKRGDPAKALPLFEQAVAQNQNHANYHLSLATTLAGLGQSPEAATHYTWALQLDPTLTEAYNNLGNLLLHENRHSEAIPLYRKALELDPKLTLAYYNLGNALQHMGDYENALFYYQKGLDGLPESSIANMIKVQSALSQPAIPNSQAQINHARTRTILLLKELLGAKAQFAAAQAFNSANFFFAYQGMNNRDLQRVLAKFWLITCPELRPRELPWEIYPRRGERIQLGICSSLLHQHTIGKLYQGLIDHFDRRCFEVWLLRPSDSKSDAMSAQLQAAADHVVHLSSIHEQARQQIAELALDILFYPDIGMMPFSYYLSFHRLAPVQCTSWGHPDTTGVPTMDYFLSSELIEEKYADQHYTEQLIRLRHLPTYYYHPAVDDLIPDRASIGLPESNQVKLYVCPQSLFKFHPEADHALGDLLRRDPNGVLVLIHGIHRTWSDLLRQRFANCFPDVVDRVAFVNRLSEKQFLMFLKCANVLLDPPHFGGGNTSYEAFAMEIPIVTWPGPFMRGRVTAGIYQSMGFTELIADNAEHYLQLAYRIANDLEYRQYCQERIRQCSSVLYENIEVVREMEDFFIAALTAARQGERLIRWPLTTENRI